MGFNFSNLTSILFGIGAGVILVSCLTVTVCFGENANSFNSFQKNVYKINFESSIIDTSLAICVFGCLAAVATLAALVIYFILDSKIILLIVQIVPIVFIFGCLVAEGIFTIKATDKEANWRMEEYKHDKAQKHIAESIKELYEQGLTNLREEHSELRDEEIFSWERISQEFSTIHNVGIGSSIPPLRFNSIWNEYPNKENYGEYGKFINLYLNNDGLIMAKFKEKKSIVASTKFRYEYSYTPKYKICWYDNEISMKCKTFKGKKQSSQSYFTFEGRYDDDYSLFLNEKVTQYNQIYDIQYGESFLVEDFPVAYHLLTYEDVQKEEDKSEEDDQFVFDDSTNHFKVSGKKWGKSFGSYLKDANEKIQKDSFIVTPKEAKSIENAIIQCEEYYDEYGKRESDPDPHFCNFEDEGTSLDDIKEYLRSNYEDFNMGKEVPYLKKQFKKQARSSLNNQLKTPYSYGYLYTLAIINLVVQIVGALFLAGSAVLGVLFGGNSDGDNSEKEGA